MSIAELLPVLHALPRSEKLRVIQVLVADIAREDDQVADMAAPQSLWSPYDAYDAATTLLTLLDQEKAPSV